jgi:DNA-binding transcriptional MocR family regulator
MPPLKQLKSRPIPVHTDPAASSVPPDPSGQPLYESIAQHVTRLIQGGTFRPGERVPSVRGLSDQLHVSITTVLGAYRLLESRGYLEPRPQSGYFVRSGAAAPRAQPVRCNTGQTDVSMCNAARGANRVSVQELLRMVLRDSYDPNLVQLGAAIPNPRMLPMAALNRTVARISRAMPERTNAYCPPPGAQELRVQIARRALTQGCTLTPDEVLVTTGSQEAITTCLQALCRPGDTVALESPCYYGFLQAMETMGIKGLEIPTDPREGMDLRALEEALRTHTVKAVLVISNFNNPLGTCMPTARKQELVEMLAARDIPLIEDDVYGDLYFGERPTTCKAFDRKGLVLHCNSFSKTLSPGLRVGWTAPGRFIEQVSYLKIVNSLASPTLPQLVVADFLANGGYERHLRRLRRSLSVNVRQMADAVLRHFPEGTTVTHPAGGHVLWVRMPESIDSRVLYARALEKGITIAPGPLFSTRGLYTNFVRLNAAFWSGGSRGAMAGVGAGEEAVRRLGHLAGALLN